MKAGRKIWGFYGGQLISPEKREYEPEAVKTILLKENIEAHLLHV